MNWDRVWNLCSGNFKLCSYRINSLNALDSKLICALQRCTVACKLAPDRIFLQVNEFVLSDTSARFARLVSRPAQREFTSRFMSRFTTRSTARCTTWCTARDTMHNTMHDAIHSHIWLPSPDHDHEPRFIDHGRARALLGSWSSTAPLGSLGIVNPRASNSLLGSFVKVCMLTRELPSMLVSSRTMSV